MTIRPHPKPSARPKRQPKRLQRRPAHKTARKAARVRKKTDRHCIVQRCMGMRYPGLGLCRKHATAKADELWGRLIRKDGCEIDHAKYLRCGGRIEACHGFSRGYRAIRWSLLNGWSGCAAVNYFADTHPLQWDQWLRDQWGMDVYEQMRQAALNGREPDLAEVIGDFEERLKAA